MSAVGDEGSVFASKMAARVLDFAVFIVLRNLTFGSEFRFADYERREMLVQYDYIFPFCTGN